MSTWEQRVSQAAAKMKERNEIRSEDRSRIYESVTSLWNDGRFKTILEFLDKAFDKKKALRSEDEGFRKLAASYWYYRDLFEMMRDHEKEKPTAI